MILGFKDFLHSRLNKQQSAAENNIGIPTAVMMAGSKTRGSNTGMMPTLYSLTVIMAVSAEPMTVKIVLMGIVVIRLYKF